MSEEQESMQEKKEKIGGVTLDLTYYPGQDFYSDGEIENELLSIVQNHTPDQYDSIIREKKEWPILYHLSPARGNIADWIPFKGTEKVLEIGAGPGAVTGTLSSRCGSVTCVELSERRSRINAYRHQDRDNITIMVGNFEDIEPHLDTDYDYIFLIGVLEYAGSYIHGVQDPYYEELVRIMAHLKRPAAGETEAGRLVIAIENRLGLKYFAGCAEDHSGRYFDGIESYLNEQPPAKTFSRTALEKLLAKAGATKTSFYYPYPDYKFMEALYSDRYLPSASDLSDNIRNFDMDRLLLFNEKKAYRGITEDGLYPVFANSFAVVAGPPLDVIYCKYSGERADRFRIRTKITLDSLAGRSILEVVKSPLSKEAEEHVSSMVRLGEKLTERYTVEEKEDADGILHFSQPVLHVAQCRKAEDEKSVIFPFVEGKSLEMLLDESLAANDAQGFIALLDGYRDRVGINEEAGISDYDMTFSNIIVDRDAWTAIDYEWAREQAVPVKDLLFRALLVYYLEDDRRREKTEALIGNDALLERYGISPEEAARLAEDEMQFQNYVTGGIDALGELRAQMGARVIKPAELQSESEKKKIREAKEKETNSLAAIQVYFDTGSGFNEKESYFEGNTYMEEGVCEFTVDVPRNVKRLRIDPALCPCIVFLKDASFLKAGRDQFLRKLRTNGTAVKNGSFLFTTSDPNMVWDMGRLRRKAGLGFNPKEDGSADTIRFVLQMTGIPSTMAKGI